MTSSENLQPPTNRFQTAFVGRERELNELVSALDDAVSGRGRIVMLSGEPGIGKTRMAQELARIAENRGVDVLWGRCYESEGAPPYWPWIQAIRTFVNGREPEYLSSNLGIGASVVAEIVPEISDKLPDLDPLPPHEPEQARFRLFDSVASFLKNASRTRPLLVVLDDLHWADTSTLLMLEFVTSVISADHLMILGAYRGGDITRRHPLSESLGILVRENHFSAVELQGLDSQEVARLAHLTIGENVDSDLVDAIYGRTQGNPLFVNELTRLVDPGADQQNWSSAIPTGVRDVIGRRLNRLSQTCNELLTTASVVGQEFDYRLIEKLLDRHDSPGGFLDALDEAIRANVIVESSLTPGLYDFSHALVQETLVDELSTTRRVRLHAQIVSILEEQYRGDLEAHAAELAYHTAEAELVLGTEKVVRYSITAGERALATYAYEEALGQFRRALEAKGTQVLDDESAAILAGLGHVLTALGHHEEAATNVRRAFSYYVEIGDITGAVQTVEFHHNENLNRLIKDTLADALELVPTGSLQSARLLCSYGLSTGSRGNAYVQGQQALEESLEIARVEGDSGLERRIMAAYAQVDGCHMRWGESLDRCLRALEMSTDVGADPIDRLRAYSWACNVSYAIGDTGAAKRYTEDAKALAGSIRDSYWLGSILWRQRVLDYLIGDWDSVQEPSALPSHTEFKGSIAMSYFQTGDFDKGKAYMNQAIGQSWPLVASFFCYITGETDLLDEIEATAKSASTPEMAPIRAWELTVALALASVTRNDSLAAAEQYEALNPYTNAVTQNGVCADYILGLLATTMGNSKLSKEHFEDAISFCRKAGHRPNLAWSLFEYANVVGPSADTAGHKGVLGLLNESLSISTELRMRPLVERVTTLQAKLESRLTETSTYPDNLTQREVEVLRLLASGHTNQEIADELFIALNTVARHVSNIYTKTDSANRAEATLYASRHDLV